MYDYANKKSAPALEVILNSEHPKYVELINTTFVLYLQAIQNAGYSDMSSFFNFFGNIGDVKEGVDVSNGMHNHAPEEEQTSLFLFAVMQISSFRAHGSIDASQNWNLVVTPLLTHLQARTTPEAFVEWTRQNQLLVETEVLWLNEAKGSACQLLPSKAETSSFEELCSRIGTSRELPPHSKPQACCHVM